MRGLSLAVAGTAVALAACTGGGKSDGGTSSAPTAQIVARMVTSAGGAAGSADVDAAVRVIRQRFDAAGLSAQIKTNGAELDVTVSAADKAAAIPLVSQVGQLRFRQVLGIAPGSAANQPSAANGSSGGRPVAGSSSRDPRKVVAVFDTYDCGLGAAPTLGLDRVQDFIVACDASGRTKYLLGPAGVGGPQIGSAGAVLDPTTNVWLVHVTFVGSGPKDWYTLTKTVYEADQSQSPTTCQAVNINRGCNEIAITLDGVVQSAPSVQQDGISGGEVQVTGNFTKQQAQALADLLKFGALPVRVVLQTVTTR